MKQLLTISLGQAGAQDAVPEILAMLPSEKDGSIRGEMLQTLGLHAIRPRGSDGWRDAYGVVWRRLDEKTTKAVRAALLAGLEDTYRSYSGPKPDDRAARYPVQTVAAESLSLVGYVVKQVCSSGMVIGWSVHEKNGAHLHTASLRNPFHRSLVDERWEEAR